MNGICDAAFPDVPRVDAIAKVRGAVRFCADDVRPGMIHASLATASIARGRIVTIDVNAATAVPGVRLVLTHENIGPLKTHGFVMAGGYGFQSIQPLASDLIAYRGQPIALVAADTLEAAVEGAGLVTPTYASEAFNVTLDAPDEDIVNQADTPIAQFIPEVVIGDADRALADAPVTIDARFSFPPQHQNPMELLATVAEWDGESLVIHESTQNAEAIRHGVATALAISADRIRVVSPFAGGAFGQKNSLQMQTILAVIAARRLGRPVKLVVPRWQIFHDASFRPATRHRLRLGADHSGRMLAAIHEVDAQTSRHDFFPLQYVATTSRLHNIENFRGHERLVRTDVQTPGYMRTPFEHVACFTMESCVDELAYELNMDPVELRLANDTATDPVTKLPLSSRHVAECLRRGADRFGWRGRSMAPGSMRSSDGACVGWGVALGTYPCLIVPQIVRLKATDDGRVFIDIGAHEMGQGIRNVLSAIVGRKLGVAPECIVASIGDTRAVPQHLTAGAWGTASVAPAASDAADALLEALAKLVPAPLQGTPAELLRAAGQRELEVEIRRKAPGQPDEIFDRLRAGLVSLAGPEYPHTVTFSYVAHFVEVHVEERTRRIRVPRVVSVVDCGRVISPRTAASQVRGGVVWGIGAALREATEVDPRYGGFLNADLAEYVVAVNADVGSIDVEFIDAPDFTFNNVGAKSLGEVALAGVAPAIGNAVFHATGRRVRDLPIRIEHVL